MLIFLWVEEENSAVKGELGRNSTEGFLKELDHVLFTTATDRKGVR